MSTDWKPAVGQKIEHFFSKVGAEILKMEHDETKDAGRMWVIKTEDLPTESYIYEACLLTYWVPKAVEVKK